VGRQRRLRLVRAWLSQALDQASDGPLRLVILCAGHGHDVIGVLPGHPRRHDVRAVLVEGDVRNAEEARRAARQAGLDQVEVRQADAGTAASFADALPADMLLLCGIFGNVSEPDIQRTIEAALAMCRPGATVIWTRHRRPPDLTPRIRAWFTGAGFDEAGFDALGADGLMSVGAARLARVPQGRLPEGPLFTFGSARRRAGPPGDRVKKENGSAGRDHM
jgi:hypothetical protein